MPPSLHSSSHTFRVSKIHSSSNDKKKHIFLQANRDHEAVIKQSEFISKDLSGEERLQKALDEISNLTKKLHEQKTEFDNKVEKDVFCTSLG
jgi:predicted transcriptional regulator